MPEERVCSACGRRVWADDRYCPGCGVSFGGVPEGAERGRTLPGIDYHFVQGAIISLITLLLITLAAHAMR